MTACSVHLQAPLFLKTLGFRDIPLDFRGENPESLTTQYRRAPFLISGFGGAYMQRQDRKRKTSGKERSSTVLRFASFPHSIIKRSAGASRVEMNALRAPLTPLPTSLGARAVLRFHRFSLDVEVRPPQKNGSDSSVLRHFLARWEERPFVVPFERFLNSLRKERPS